MKALGKYFFNLILIGTLFSCKEDKNNNINDNKISKVKLTESNKINLIDKFVNDNEEIIYSFKTKSGKQLIIVKDTANAYIQYRFGKEKNIEMKYPEISSKESWNKFKYNSYLRGGGKENAGMEIDNLQFKKNGYTYLIYRAYFAENEKNSAGIIITDSQNKEIRINGIASTITGCICNLEDTQLIEKTDIGLSF
jgi:hypothetical protein